MHTRFIKAVKGFIFRKDIKKNILTSTQNKLNIIQNIYYINTLFLLQLKINKYTRFDVTIPETIIYSDLNNYCIISVIIAF